MLPHCVACLYAIGWGIKRIMRHTGYAKTSIHRFARWNNCTDATTAARRKRAENMRRKRAAANRIEPNARDYAAWWKQEWRGVAFLGELRHWNTHPSIINERAKIRARDIRARALLMREPPNWLIAKRIRTRVYKAIMRGGAAKSAATVELLGCTIPLLRQHLQAMFTEGMSWANYGEWEIDHIRPCASFDLRDHEQQLACFHYTNLQPLWRAENRRKWATYEEAA